MKAMSLVSSGDVLGESVIWTPGDKSVFWVDGLGPIIHRLEVASGRHSTFVPPIGLPLGMIAETSDPSVLALTHRDGVFLYELSSSRMTLLAHPEAGRENVAYNDAKVDREGRLWVGTFDTAETEPRGTLWALPDGGESPVLVETGIVVTNGPAFSPNGDTLYLSDSIGKRILSYRVDRRALRLSDRRVFCEFGPSEGLPDGLTVDADGCLWCAHWEGSRVTRFSPEGQRITAIPLPVPRVTSVAFGGEQLDTLFITTARYGMDAVDIAKNPTAGNLFSINAGVKGLAATPLPIRPART
jgi:D-xylonolactonase